MNEAGLGTAIRAGEVVQHNGTAKPESYMAMDILPTIPVPLLAQERATLDLQSALHQAYDAAGYEDYLYANTPTPPLQGADAEWVKGLMAVHGS
jgi:hypothetical protein